ncbi:hypothetical protein [Sphingobium phenoxybenzoativorans]|uniref:hypothetical protein n=1 Tax=Sphingobium phenoxybenzoativorans TaxID=1592790 RepID=UPI001112E526|nr:hypothetical protein [Sphingobium phenoxybenzoativorans]
MDRWLNKLEAEAGDDPRRVRHWKDCRSTALGKTGFAKYFGKDDVNTITPNRIDQFILFKKANSSAENLKPTTVKRNIVLLNVVLKFAHADRLLTFLPTMPKVRTKDNPRPWFEHAEYQRLHNAARDKAKAAKNIGDSEAADYWDELSDFIIFMVGSFLRPGEWPELKHKHVKIVTSDPPYLELDVIKSKTTQRKSVTMQTALSAYKRIVKRNKRSPEAYVFKPTYLNRQTARERMADAFEALLDDLGMKEDVYGRKRSTYSLRHTSLMLRFIKGDNVDILALAKNAGTSVDQLERFYLNRINVADKIVSIQSLRRGAARRY